MNLLFSSDIVKLLLKTNGERDRNPNCVIFVVGNALIVGGWMEVAWSRKSCLGPAEITFLVFLVFACYVIFSPVRRNKFRSEIDFIQW